MRVLLYTIKRSLAKLNIKHRMCCNEPTDYKMLTKFFPDIFALSYVKDVRKDVTPIYWGTGCAIFRPIFLGWKIKTLGSIFSLQLTFWSDSHGTHFIFKVWEGVLVLNGNWNRFPIFLC